MWRNTVEQTTVMENTMNTQLCPIKKSMAGTINMNHGVRYRLFNDLMEQVH